MVKAKMWVKNPQRFYVCTLCKSSIPILIDNPDFKTIEEEFKEKHSKHPVQIISEEQFNDLLGLSEWQ